MQVLEGDQGDSVRLVVAVEDLKQVGAAAGQDGPVSHQLMTTNLKNSGEANRKWNTGLETQRQRTTVYHPSRSKLVNAINKEECDKVNN